MTPPRYQAITRDSIPEYHFAGGKVRVIAGKLKDTIGPAMTHSPVELYDIRFDGVGKLDFSLPEGYNAMMLITE